MEANTHNTQGRYRVGAKSEKEAEILVRDIIGFGSVQFYYWDDSPAYICDYKEVILEKIDHENSKDYLKFKYVKPHHANAPKETWDEDLDR